LHVALEWEELVALRGAGGPVRPARDQRGLPEAGSSAQGRTLSATKVTLAEAVR